MPDSSSKAARLGHDRIPFPRRYLGVATSAFVVLAIILSVIAFFGQQGLDDRKVRGGQRVLDSLRAERQVLEEQQKKNALPGAFFEAETDHIKDEEQQQTEELKQLQQASNG